MEVFVILKYEIVRNIITLSMILVKLRMLCALDAFPRIYELWSQKFISLIGSVFMFLYIIFFRFVNF